MKPREINTHITPGNPVNESIKVYAVDGPGPGGASHFYLIEPLNGPRCEIHFQMGGIAEVGVNGLTNEALLAVVQDRLVSFQNGPFPCKENNVAALHVAGALNALHDRTRARVARGVEGKTVA